MSRTIRWFCLLLLTMIWLTSAMAQVYEDSLVFVNQIQLPQVPGVQLYVMQMWQNGSYEGQSFWGIDSNYVKMYTNWFWWPDTEWTPQPIKFVKSTNLQVGNQWYTWLNDTTALVEATDDSTWMVGSTPVQGMKIEMTPAGYSSPQWTWWWSNNVGILGFYQILETEVGTMSIESYHVQGGSGYLPMAVGNYWRMHEVWGPRTFEVPTVNVTLNGNMDEWTTTDPVIRDEQGDDPSSYNGCDVKDVYIALSPDRTMLYLMADFWDGAPSIQWGQLQNSAYHFSVYYVSPQSPAEIDVFYWIDQQWELNGWNIETTNAVVAVGNVIEIGIPMADLGNPQLIYNYKLELTNGSQLGDHTDPVNVNLAQSSVKNPEKPVLPDRVTLYPSYPNPFNPTTNLTFTLPHAAKVSLEVFDINGRSVGAQGMLPTGLGTTPPPSVYEAGTHTIPFDGTGLPSGIYFARLTMSGSGPEGMQSQTTPTTATQKLVLMK